MNRAALAALLVGAFSAFRPSLSATLDAYPNGDQPACISEADLRIMRCVAWGAAPQSARPSLAACDTGTRSRLLAQPANVLASGAYSDALSSFALAPNQSFGNLAHVWACERCVQAKGRSQSVAAVMQFKPTSSFDARHATNSLHTDPSKDTLRFVLKPCTGSVERLAMTAAGRTLLVSCVHVPMLAACHTAPSHARGARARAHPALPRA